jgi:hypothetical protein
MTKVYVVLFTLFNYHNILISIVKLYISTGRWRWVELQFKSYPTFTTSLKEKAVLSINNIIMKKKAVFYINNIIINGFILEHFLAPCWEQFIIATVCITAWRITRSKYIYIYIKFKLLKSHYKYKSLILCYIPN